MEDRIKKQETMTDREKIIVEIERLKNWEPINITQEQIRKLVQRARLGVLIGLEEFINSLPAEYPSEDLKKEIELWIEKEITGVNPIYTTGAVGCIIENTARYFANWQKEQMLKGFCYETKVYRDEEGDGIDTPIESWLALENNEIMNLPDIGLKDGDKVKVIIVKEDEQ